MKIADSKAAGNSTSYLDDGDDEGVIGTDAPPVQQPADVIQATEKKQRPPEYYFRDLKYADALLATMGLKGPSPQKISWPSVQGTARCVLSESGFLSLIIECEGKAERREFGNELPRAYALSRGLPEKTPTIMVCRARMLHEAGLRKVVRRRFVTPAGHSLEALRRNRLVVPYQAEGYGLRADLDPPLWQAGFAFDSDWGLPWCNWPDQFRAYAPRYQTQLFCVARSALIRAGLILRTSRVPKHYRYQLAPRLQSDPGVDLEGLLALIGSGA